MYLSNLSSLSVSDLKAVYLFVNDFKYNGKKGNFKNNEVSKKIDDIDSLALVLKYKINISFDEDIVTLSHWLGNDVKTNSDNFLKDVLIFVLLSFYSIDGKRIYINPELIDEYLFKINPKVIINRDDEVVFETCFGDLFISIEDLLSDITKRNVFFNEKTESLLLDVLNNHSTILIDMRYNSFLKNFCVTSLSSKENGIPKGNYLSVLPMGTMIFYLNFYF